MEPYEPLLLPSFADDDPENFQKKLSLYESRLIMPRQTDEQILERLLSTFELIEITDPDAEPLWGKLFPLPEIENGGEFSHEEAWNLLATSRSRKWKVPNSQKNEFFYANMIYENTPLWVIYDTQEGDFFDSINRNAFIFDYLRGIDPFADQREKESYLSSIEMINKVKAHKAYHDVRMMLDKTARAELFLPGKKKIEMGEDLAHDLAYYISDMTPISECADFSTRPSADYMLRFSDSVRECFFFGDQSSPYYHDFMRIPLQDTRPETKHLNEALCSMVSGQIE